MKESAPEQNNDINQQETEKSSFSVNQDTIPEELLQDILRHESENYPSESTIGKDLKLMEILDEQIHKTKEAIKNLDNSAEDNRKLKENLEKYKALRNLPLNLN